MEKQGLVLGVDGPGMADDALNEEGRGGLGERDDGKTACGATAVPVIWVDSASASGSNGASDALVLSLGANVVDYQL